MFNCPASTRWLIDCALAHKLLVKCGEAFSLRDEIAMCPYIEEDLEVIDKSPFFIRPFHVKEEDKPMIANKKQRLVHLGILIKDM